MVTAAPGVGAALARTRHDPCAAHMSLMHDGIGILGIGRLGIAIWVLAFGVVCFDRYRGAERPWNLALSGLLLSRLGRPFADQ